MAPALYYACALLAGVALLCRGELTVSIEEPSVTMTNTVLLQLPEEEPREIRLVPSRTYHIHCRSTMGFSGRSDVWKLGNGNPIPITEPTAGSSAVYASVIGTDQTRWTLVVQAFSPNSDAGVYYCDGYGGGTNATLSIQAGTPTVIAGTISQALVVGNRGNRPTLHAFASPPPSNPSSELVWSFNGGAPSARTIISGYQLIFPSDITHDLAGRYMVMYSPSGGGGPVSAIFDVVVNAPPDVSVSILNTDNSVTIICVDTQGKPAPEYSWLRGDDNIVNSSRFTIISRIGVGFSNSTLTIDSIVPGDVGQYKCQASNAAGTSTVATNIFVPQIPLLSHSTPAQHVVIENSTVVLSATLSAAYPPVTAVVWHREGVTDNRTVNPATEDFSDFSISFSGYNLTIVDVKPEDSGVYFVEARNEVGSGSVRFSLSVVAPPVLIPSTSLTIHRATGSSVTLTSTILRAHPPVTSDDITWYHKITPLDLSDSKVTATLEDNVASLSVTGLAVDDSGSYRLDVSHTAGARSTSFQLNVQIPPSPPTNLNATLLSSSYCLSRLTWTPPPAPPTSDTAAAEHIILETRVGDLGGWSEIDRVNNVLDTSATISLPGHSPNASYHFRAVSWNSLVGKGAESGISTPLSGYPYSVFPTITSVESTPLDSASLEVTWRVSPQQDCVTFMGFEVECTSTSGDIARRPADKDDLSAVVNDLVPESVYRCHVIATLGDIDGNLFTSYRLESEDVSAETPPVKAATVIDVTLIAAVVGGLGGALVLALLLILVLMAVVCRGRRKSRTLKHTNGAIPNPLYDTELAKGGSYKTSNGHPPNGYSAHLDPALASNVCEALDPSEFTGDDIIVVSMETLVQQGAVSLNEPMYEPIPK